MIDRIRKPYNLASHIEASTANHVQKIPFVWQTRDKWNFILWWHRKFKSADVPTIVSRGAPDFCTVYVINKQKMSSARNASRPVPHTSPLQYYLESIVKDKPNLSPPVSTPPRRSLSIRGFFASSVLLYYLMLLLLKMIESGFCASRREAFIHTSKRWQGVKVHPVAGKAHSLFVKSVVSFMHSSDTSLYYE